jgi:hypothetical protein
MQVPPRATRNAGCALLLATSCRGGRTTLWDRARRYVCAIRAPCYTHAPRRVPISHDWRWWCDVAQGAWSFPSWTLGPPSSGPAAPTVSGATHTGASLAACARAWRSAGNNALRGAGADLRWAPPVLGDHDAPPTGYRVVVRSAAAAALSSARACGRGAERGRCAGARTHLRRRRRRRRFACRAPEAPVRASLS